MYASLYIHIPFCLRKCAYCDFFSVPNVSFLNQDGLYIQEFITALSTEFSLRCSEFEITRLNSIYIGGGTPSLLPPATVSILAKNIIENNKISVPSDIEWTIEANPEDLSLEWIRACETSGVTRISLGVQTLVEDSFTALGRRGSILKNLDALKMLSTYWKGKVSVDLISGLPDQNLSDLLADIHTVASYSPDHISLYSLTIEPGTLMDRQIDSGLIQLPDQDTSDNLWIMGRDELEKLGFLQYEVSNFAKPGSESRHNLTYWNLDSYLGIGPGATGTICINDSAVRYTNTTDIELWKQNPGAADSKITIDRSSFIFENIMMGFRKISGINRVEFRHRFQCEIEDVIPITLDHWNRKGLIRMDQEAVALSRDGLLILNTFLTECLDELG